MDRRLSGSVSDCVSKGRTGMFLLVVCCRLFPHRDFGVQGALTRPARSTPCHLSRGGTHSHSFVTTHSPTLLAGSGIDGRGLRPHAPPASLRPDCVSSLGSAYGRWRGREVTPTLFCFG